MNFRKLLHSAFRLGAILLVAGACSDHTGVGPTAARVDAGNSQLLGSVLDPVFGLLTPAKAVSRITPLAHDITVSKTIGRRGGIIAIPQAGFLLYVPKNAVSKNTVFTVTAVAGHVIAYEFAPHGATFREDLTIIQSLSGTDWYRKGFRSAKGGYFTDRGLIDQLLRVVMTLELLPAQVKGGFIKFEVEHFSGYMVAGC